jgi:hypothetical protein
MATESSETSVNIDQAIRHHIPEDHSPKINFRDNIIFYTEDKISLLQAMEAHRVARG